MSVLRARADHQAGMAGRESHAEARYAVICTHHNCVIYRQYGQAYWTLKRAIKHWNKRAVEKKDFWKWAN